MGIEHANGGNHQLNGEKFTMVDKETQRTPDIREAMLEGSMVTAKQGADTNDIGRSPTHLAPGHILLAILFGYVHSPFLFP